MEWAGAGYEKRRIMFRSQRSLSLDVLRATAILLVLGNHMHALSPGHAAWLTNFAQTWKRGGWIGVDLFFVLSGFLVSGLLFREYQKYQHVQPLRFLIRRGFKIYPSYWVLLVVIFALQAAHHKFQSSQFLADLFFYQNYRPLQASPNTLTHTWSLAVEEHFYFGITALIALLVAARRRVNPFDALPGIFIVIAVAALALRIGGALTGPFEFNRSLARTHLRVDSLFFGVLLSYFFTFHNDRLKRLVTRFWYLLLPAGLALLAPPFIWERDSSPWIYAAGPTFYYLGSGLILLVLVFYEPRPLAPIRWLGFMGANSYAIYLWHVPMNIWMEKVDQSLHIAPRSVGSTALFMLSSIAVGIGMSLLVDLPSLRLRDRLFPSRSGSPVAPPRDDAPPPASEAPTLAVR